MIAPRALAAVLTLAVLGVLAALAAGCNSGRALAVGSSERFEFDKVQVTVELTGEVAAKLLERQALILSRQIRNSCHRADAVTVVAAIAPDGWVLESRAVPAEAEPCATDLVSAQRFRASRRPSLLSMTFRY